MALTGQDHVFVILMALTGQEHVFKIYFLLNEKCHWQVNKDMTRRPKDLTKGHEDLTRSKSVH